MVAGSCNFLYNVPIFFAIRWLLKKKTWISDGCLKKLKYQMVAEKLKYKMVTEKKSNQMVAEKLKYQMAAGSW